ncbi:hypothetical protein O4J56_10085 [Nocardiopsis sp. RSe5-2]|uniref:DUF3352 domain-containing protein n=1 Tax=Nocardiopsis endophytica TaxID=3018445 RepID=A0ABT4U218_9ACTN|nr:hypothetical protein [Nocardiopsis endophytica]MDA2810984.1 hypothetical protein [Nocardiopsis endophytica]
MIPVAAGLGVLLMGSGVWAANTVVTRLFGGPQPDTVLPGDAAGYFQVDLKPSGAQLTDYASFAGKLPDSVKDELGSDEDPAAALFDEILESSDSDLSYEDDIEPWLGKRFGFAAMGTGADEEGPTFEPVVAIAVTDEGAADEVVDDLAKDFSGSEDGAGEVRDGFMFLTESTGTLDDVEKKVEEEGSLADNETYSSDMAGVSDDSLAAMWYDLGSASDLIQEGLSGASDPFSTGYDEYGDYEDYSDYGSGGSSFEDMEFDGRIAAAVSVDADYAELRADLIDFQMGDFSLGDYTTEQTGLSEMAELPDDTMIALGGSGLDELSEQSWNDMAGVMPEEFDEAESALQEMGISVPEGFTDLLGTQTALGMSGLDSGLSDPFEGFDSGSVQYRAAGADAGLIEDLVEEASQGSYSSPPGVNSDGDTVVVSSGATGQGRLGDDPVYKQVMQGNENAVFGMYMDLRPFAESEGESDSDQWGAVGYASSLDGERATTNIRWAPSGE